MCAHASAHACTHMHARARLPLADSRKKGLSKSSVESMHCTQYIRMHALCVCAHVPKRTVQSPRTRHKAITHDVSTGFEVLQTHGEHSSTDRTSCDSDKLYATGWRQIVQGMACTACMSRVVAHVCPSASTGNQSPSLSMFEWRHGLWPSPVCTQLKRYIRLGRIRACYIGSHSPGWCVGCILGHRYSFGHRGAMAPTKNKDCFHAFEA